MVAYSIKATVDSRMVFYDRTPKTMSLWFNTGEDIELGKCSLWWRVSRAVEETFAYTLIFIHASTVLKFSMQLSSLPGLEIFQIFKKLGVKWYQISKN